MPTPRENGFNRTHETKRNFNAVAVATFQIGFKPRSGSHRRGGCIEILEGALKLYAINRWDEHFENNRSRTVKDLSWVSIPNRHDGEHFSTIMQHEHGAEIFSAFILMVQVASKCTPRGVLVRDDGTPHTDRSLSAKCRCPAMWFKIAFDYLEANTDWLEIKDLEPNCQRPVSVLSASCQDPAKKGGKERREGEGMEEPPKPKYPPLEEVKLFCAKAGIPESDAVWFWHKCEGNGWTNGGQKIKSWQNTLTAWKSAGYLPTQKNAAKVKPVSSVPGGRF